MKRAGLIAMLPIAFVLAALSPGHAGEVTLPNTFTAGTPAVAAEVNANFTALEIAVDDNGSRVAALEALVSNLKDNLDVLKTIVRNQAITIDELNEDLVTVRSSQVMALNAYLLVDETSDARGPLVQLSGVNLQLVNGLGSTDTINGLGNLIVGYDEESTLNNTCCSDGAYADQESCEGAGAVWSRTHKTGSHYLVLGAKNNYSQYGGLVAGYQNYAIRAYSTVTGGDLNMASGIYSSVSGGHMNQAGGVFSSVSGGEMNTSSNNASSVGGGQSNEATGWCSSVSGGGQNKATGGFSSVSGGARNTASGNSSSVSGGYEDEATGQHDWVAGDDLWQDD